MSERPGNWRNSVRSPSSITQHRGPLVVIGKLDVGGTEQHLLQTLPLLRERDVDARVYVLRGKGQLEQAFRYAGIPVKSPKLQLPGRLGLLTGTLGLLVTLLRERPRVVHFFLPEAYVIGGVLSLLASRTKRVMSRRSLDNYQGRHGWLGAIERWLHRRMDAVLGNSRAVIAQLEREGVPERKLSLIYNGLDASRFQLDNERRASRRSLDLSDTSLVLIFVANLIPYKGHQDLLEALASIRGELPAEWMVLMVGRDDGIGSALAARVRELDLDSNVLWLGERMDVPWLLAAADIGVLPSHQEGFSNSILEGMAAGLPMIVTDVGGNSEAVEDGVTGVVVPARDPRRLGEAIRSLAQDQKQRVSLGFAARNRVVRQFSIESTVEKYQHLYTRLAVDVEAGLTTG